MVCNYRKNVSIFAIIYATTDEINEAPKHYKKDNIAPQARSFEKNKAVQRSMQILSDDEEYLAKEQEGELLQKFLDLVNAWSLVNGKSNLDSFITGFRLGAQFTMDTFVTTKVPYADYLKET